MSQDQRKPDDGFAATEKDVKAIKAVVAEIAQAEDGIAERQEGIASLTKTLVVARYRLGSLLMSLPGASANLKKARGAWCKKAIELCGNKDRVYMARDVFNYFEDPPYGHKIRASGTTGEERAKAFDGTLGELDYFIRDKKYSDAASRKRERERVAAEAAKGADRREPAAVQGAAPRILTWQSVEKVHHPARAGDNARESEVMDGPAPLDTDAPGKPAKEEGDDYCAYIASEFVDLCGHDVQQAVAYLIDRRWNRADALEWLTAWAGKGTKRPEAA